MPPLANGHERDPYVSVGVDGLLWWIQGMSLPPLVTTSPAGTPQAQAGVLGTPGVGTLFGGDHVGEDLRGGGQLNVCIWSDRQNPETAIETHFFFLGNSPSNFTASSNGDPILSRPFFNASTNAQDAELVAFPNVLTGTVNVHTSTDLWSAEVLLARTSCAAMDAASMAWLAIAPLGCRTGSMSAKTS